MTQPPDAPREGFLADQTTREAKRLCERGAVALLPVGSTEAHGPHLPLSTDVIIAEETARRARLLLAVRGVDAVVLPPVAYAVTEFLKEFAGTVSVRAETVARLLEEIADALFAQEFRVLCLVNGHLEPEHGRMLKQVAATVTARGRGIAVFPDQRRPPVVAELGAEFGRGGAHAGGFETSLVLAAAPALVREGVRARLGANEVDLAARMKAGATSAREAGGPDAYFGDPAGASAAEGHRLFDVLARMTADAVADAFARGGGR